jgi:L-threonylcarbamoyladenylate synthase
VRVIGAGDLTLAVSALEAGDVVAVPTDTVYGLAVRLSPAGVESVYAMKGRPVDLALPVVVGSIEQASGLAAAWPSNADALAKRFWPGALTLVVAAPAALGALVGGPGDSVGLRWPRHGVLNELCAALGPLAVTSANRHGVPPATEVQDVVRSFGADGPAVVVDGGLCDGVPSTVADCTAEPVRRLRDGGVPWGEIVAELSGVGRV